MDIVHMYIVRVLVDVDGLDANVDWITDRLKLGRTSFDGYGYTHTVRVLLGLQINTHINRKFNTRSYEIEKVQQ